MLRQIGLGQLIIGFNIARIELQSVAIFDHRARVLTFLHVLLTAGDILDFGFLRISSTGAQQQSHGHHKNRNNEVLFRGAHDSSSKIMSGPQLGISSSRRGKTDCLKLSRRARGLFSRSFSGGTRRAKASSVPLAEMAAAPIPNFPAYP